jgi:hypothetical protein
MPLPPVSVPPKVTVRVVFWLPLGVMLVAMGAVVSSIIVKFVEALLVPTAFVTFAFSV